MISVTEIDALLPQTQCGECGYPGCHPYAEAIHSKQTPIDQCAPGGITTLTALAELLAQDPQPFIDNVTRNYRSPLIAEIREAECIGCTKCIQACPVDAIIGGPKLMHTVIAQECTGCDLCAPACPVDCIDMQAITEAHHDPEKARQRYTAKNTRIHQQQAQQTQHNTTAKQQTAIAAALTRIKTAAVPGEI